MRFGANAVLAYVFVLDQHNTKYFFAKSFRAQNFAVNLAQNGFPSLLNQDYAVVVIQIFNCFGIIQNVAADANFTIQIGEKRSRLLAQEIGEQYAQFAGNGFDVAASPTDTFGAIIKSSVTEGQADISTILENANMNKWSFEEEKRTHRRSTASDLASANASVFKAKSYSESATDYRNAAVQQMDNAQLTAAETIAYGKRAAKAAKKSGWRGMWGQFLQGAAQAAAQLED